MKAVVRPMVVGVFGPTACRKSELAMTVASEVNSEIINCDSVQVYDKVNIGANKPTPTDLEQVPHHLFSFVKPPRVYTAGQYHRDFHDVVNSSGKKTLFMVGGSGFYARAALVGLYPVEPSQPERRSELTREWEHDNGVTLFKELTLKDPVYAKKIGPLDLKRIIRALEILRFSNFKSVGELEENIKSQPRNFDVVKVALFRERSELREQIRLRTVAMLSQGLIEEVEGLLKEGLVNWAPLRSVGYAEVVAYLEGRLKKEQLVTEISQNTARLAKRQMTWLRSEESIHWFDAKTQWTEALDFVRKHCMPKGKLIPSAE